MCHGTLGVATHVVSDEAGSSVACGHQRSIFPVLTAGIR
jgi:hypothetical protein